MGIEELLLFNLNNSAFEYYLLRMTRGDIYMWLQNLPWFITAKQIWKLQADSCQKHLAESLNVGEILALSTVVMMLGCQFSMMNYMVLQYTVLKKEIL